MERLKFNSECVFVGLKYIRLIYRCKECKEEWKKPINELIKRFSSIYKFFNEDLNKFILLLRKVVYPYEETDIWEKFGETTIQPKEAFYSKLNEEGISDEDYAHVEKVWEVLKMKNRGEYHDLYAQSDTLLLADVLEKFRDKCIEIFELHPAYFVSVPGLAWLACLKRQR